MCIFRKKSSSSRFTLETSKFRFSFRMWLLHLKPDDYFGSLGGFHFDSACISPPEFTALTLEICTRLYVNAITMSCYQCLRYMYVRVRMLQRVSEPRHSKAISVMPSTHRRSQLHKHPAKFHRIIFYRNARTRLRNIRCKKSFRKELALRSQEA